DQVGGQGDDQGGGQGGVAADHGRPEQLPPARVLLGPGVADDGEQGDQGDQDRVEAGPPDGQLAQAGAVQGPVQGGEPGVGGAGGGVGLPFRGRREQPLEGGDEAGHAAGEDQEPQTPQ